MFYIIGKVIFQENNQIVFESNNVGYRFKGKVDSTDKKLFIYTLYNIRTMEKSRFAFNSFAKMQLFENLISIKGFGPLSALKLIIQNDLIKIEKARKTGNIYKLNTQGIKPSIISLIIKPENRNIDAEVILIKKSLEKYGFKSQKITGAISKYYDHGKTIDKNILSIIKGINNAK